METFYNSQKRFGIACFTRAKPPDPESDGDAAQFFDSIEDAEEWGEKALKAGRFKYLVFWDSISGSWEWSHERRARKKGRRKKK